MPPRKPVTLPIPPPTSKPVAVGYNRQSRTRPEDIEAGRVVSTALQNNQNKAWAVAHDWDYDDDLSLHASDVNVSGARKEKDKKKGHSSWRKRRGLSLLFEAAQQGKFQHLIVYKLSRLGRSAVEVNDICECFGACGVQIHVIDVNLSTGSVFGDLLLKILSAVAEMELETIREWAVESALARAQDGKHHGPMPGWIEQDAEGKYVIKEAMQDALHDMIAARLRGLPYSQIARLLNAKNHVRPRGGFGGLWTPDEVGRLLSYEYRLRLQGWAIFGLDRDDDDPRRILTPDVFPAVLSSAQADELDAVQRELVIKNKFKNADGELVNNKGRYKGKPAQASRYLLTGFAYCGANGCDAPLESEGGSRGNRFYGCQATHRVYNSTVGVIDVESLAIESSGAVLVDYETSEKEHAYVLAQNLEEAVLRAIGATFAKFGGLLVASPTAKQKGEVKPTKPKRDLNALLTAEDALTDSFTSGLITKGQYARQLERIADERASWETWETTTKAEQDADFGWASFAKQAEEGNILETAEMKLALRRIIEKVEFPVRFEGVRSTPSSRVDMPWVRITFKRALPCGDTVVLAAIHTKQYTGPRRVWIGDGPPVNLPYRAGVSWPDRSKRRDGETGRYVSRQGTLSPLPFCEATLFTSSQVQG